MLGVLKRRWKPKRASNVNRITGEVNSIETEKSRLAPSVRQVHPVCEEKRAQIVGYERRSVDAKRSSLLDANASPPPYPKRASLDSNPSPTYPLAPNICVEGGRIEFIKQSPDGAPLTPPMTPRIGGTRITVTRGNQTEEHEKYDEVKEKLEGRISELESALEAAQKSELRDKQVISKLQKQLAKREATQRDADRERRLRADSESRAKQALQEAARCRSRLKLLTSEFSRMEETVRSMLIYKKQADQLRQEKNTLTIAFENRCQQYQNTITRLNQEIFSLRQQIESSCSAVGENSLAAAGQAALLQKQAEESRRQYERCLDDVANQVVRALVTQKGLKEEVSVLNDRIEELERQNETLTSMLVHQLRGDSPSEVSEHNTSTLSPRPALEAAKDAEDNTSADASPSNLLKSSMTFKHCNSFNSDLLEITPPENVSLQLEKTLSRIEKHLSADSEVLDTRLSLEDKKRHQVLTNLWTELKGTEVTPKRLIEALSAVDSALWVPPQRPVSLNLQLPIIQATKYKRTRPVLVQSTSKSEEETGNESPESGNRDEGYSTMSSDVQAEVSRGGNSDQSQSTRVAAPLEDLKEDETEFAETRLLAPDNNDPDIFYIPINLVNLKSRNSFPPGKDLLPFQHVMRSFSDSHLCIKITTAPSPCYTFSSPISSSPSILFLDITEKCLNPLRRTKATASLLTSNSVEDKNSPGWSSVGEERVENQSWDAEYIQHWLRLDETRSTMQQQHRDLFELEYDRTELEDWSLSLSSEDVREWKKSDATTPGQISIATLPSIQENNALELEEDANECLWNSSSYMIDQDGHEIVALLMDTSGNSDKQWPYSVNYHININNSPDNSWSSAGSDYCNSNEPETYSKRSSAALSGCSDDTGELPAIGTDFTRDFYRLVKFESTKSLASTSSRSLGGALSEAGEREATLQNVLTFIAEQQKYVHCREVRESRPCSVTEVTKEFNIEAPAPQQQTDDEKTCDSNNDENYVTLKQLCAEFNSERDIKMPIIAYADEICLVTPLDVETENCSNMTEYPVDICTSNIELPKEELKSELSESLTSSISTPDTIISRIPRRKNTKLPLSPAKTNNNNNKQDSKIPKSKIPHRSKTNKEKIVHVNNSPQHVITSERLPQPITGVISDIIEGPPHRAVSFHERATSKDVIEELNRMIKNGDDNSQENLNESSSKLDQACRATGWVHLENEADLNDPKLRENLLDVMLASASSDSSPTSSCGGSVSSESVEEPPDYGQLHRIHKYHRQKKAHAARPELAVVRGLVPTNRPSIIGRQDFFVRYGEKEKEAVASFDFLDDLSTPGSSSHECSIDEE